MNLCPNLVRASLLAARDRDAKVHVVTRLQEATRGLGEKDNHPIPTEHSERPSAPAPLAAVQPGVAVACTLPDGVGHVLDRAERAVRVRLVDPAHRARRFCFWNQIK